MLIISLIANILILIPVCFFLFRDDNSMLDVFGPKTVARHILLSIYISILILSFLLLFFQDEKMVLTLLIIQVVYKLQTPFYVKSIKNPVIITNLVVTLVHIITIITIATRIF